MRPNTIGELYHEFAERVSLEHLDLICEGGGRRQILQGLPESDPTRLENSIMSLPNGSALNIST
ncbi:hypothetical protein [Anaerotruncus colihominis]|uniref:hypothetical protein n=1 Tax=Anaerotruncus colihominis TaxID=169435 RepID=UPI003D6D9C95